MLAKDLQQRLRPVAVAGILVITRGRRPAIGRNEESAATGATRRTSLGHDRASGGFRSGRSTEKMAKENAAKMIDPRDAVSRPSVIW